MIPSPLTTRSPSPAIPIIEVSPEEVSVASFMLIPAIDCPPSPPCPERFIVPEEINLVSFIVNPKFFSD